MICRYMTKHQTDTCAAEMAEPQMTQKDLTTMAIILESRHGAHAKDMAEFFASVHDKLGDAKRCCAWGDVACIVEQREQMRMAA